MQRLLKGTGIQHTLNATAASLAPCSAFGDEMAEHITDDSSPTTCAVLGLLQKASREVGTETQCTPARSWVGLEYQGLLCSRR